MNDFKFLQMKETRRLHCGENVECEHDDHGRAEAGSTLGPRGLVRRSTGTGEVVVLSFTECEARSS